MRDAKSLLIYFLADILRSEGGAAAPDLASLADHFKDDCEGVLSRYQLEERLRPIFMTMDRQIVGELLRKELLGVKTSLWSSERPAASTGLLPLVADLMRADLDVPVPNVGALFATYKSDPETVKAAYVLSAESRAVLDSKDVARISDHIFDELLLTPAPMPNDAWADPRPVIKFVDKDMLEAKPGQTLTITADCVLAKAEVHLLSDDRYNHYVAQAQVTTPVGIKNSTLTATFDLTGAEPDDYEVVIYLSRETGPIRGLAPIYVVIP